MKLWLEEFGEKIWEGSITDMPQSRYLEKLEEDADLDQIANSMYVDRIYIKFSDNPSCKCHGVQEISHQNSKSNE